MNTSKTSEPGKSTIWRFDLDNSGPTNALIRIVGSERIQSMLLDRSMLKKDVWEQVADELKAEGYELGPEGGKLCHQKWRNLKRAYIMYITKPGNRDPPYIHELQKALETTRKLLKPDRQGPDGASAASGAEGMDTEADSEPILPVRQLPNQAVYLAEVLAAVVKADKDKRRREEEMERRCEERFGRLESLLKEQNDQLDKFNNLLSELTKSNLEQRKRKLSESS